MCGDALALAGGVSSCVERFKPEGGDAELRGSFGLIGTCAGLRLYQPAAAVEEGGAFSPCVPFPAEAPAFPEGDLWLLGDEAVELALGEVRLELVAVAALFDLRRIGAVGLDVVGVESVDELAEESADGGARADVGAAEAAGHQAAQVLRRLDQQHTSAFTRGGDRGGDSRRGAPDDDYVVVCVVLTGGQ